MTVQTRSWSFALGDWPLNSGQVLRNATLTGLITGQLNKAADNLVVIPCYYGGTAQGSVPLLGAARGVDSLLGSGDYCVVLFDLFGNGQATSPSNAHPDQRGDHFPLVTIADNVAAQQQVIRQWYGEPTVALATGWSMGGMQSCQWAVSAGDQVKRLLPVCGTYRCWPHNEVFLQGLRYALRADPLLYDSQAEAVPVEGLKAFARVYAGWAYSQAFYRKALYRELGFADRAALLDYWEQDHLAQHAHDLLAMLATWEAAAGHDPGSLMQVSAETVVMPSRTDLYFTVDDACFEARHMTRAQICVLESEYGHAAGAPGREPASTAHWLTAMNRLLKSGD